MVAIYVTTKNSAQLQSRLKHGHYRVAFLTYLSGFTTSRKTQWQAFVSTKSARKLQAGKHPASKEDPRAANHCVVDDAIGTGPRVSWVKGFCFAEWIFSNAAGLTGATNFEKICI